MVHRVDSNERFSALKVTARQQNDFETPLHKIGKKEATQLIECLHWRSLPSLTLVAKTDWISIRESWETISRVPGI